MPVFKELPEALIFDLDGTLVDSLRDIADSLNACLELLGVETYPVENYRYMVGEGVPKLCRRAIGAKHPELVERLIELARARYRTRTMIHTRPYTGVPELIARLGAARIPLGVLSNKPHELTAHMVSTFWPAGEFPAVMGYITEERRKPDPQFALQIASKLGGAPQHTWIVGDTPTDIETAHNAGMRCVAVTWGFRPRADLVAAAADVIVDRPEEIF